LKVQVQVFSRFHRLFSALGKVPARREDRQN
jgi:hypothetical protein